MRVAPGSGKSAGRSDRSRAQVADGAARRASRIAATSSTARSTSSLTTTASKSAGQRLLGLGVGQPALERSAVVGARGRGRAGAALLLARRRPARTPAARRGTARRTASAPCTSISSEHVVARGEVLLDRALGACPSGRRRPRTTRGTRPRRAGARTRRGRRSGSRRRRPRPGAAARVGRRHREPQARVALEQPRARPCPCRRPTGPARTRSTTRQALTRRATVSKCVEQRRALVRARARAAAGSR